MTATQATWKVFVIEPEAAVNLFTDPSFEVGVTNCSGVGTIAQSSEQARRGKYSAKVTPGAASSDAYIYASLTLTSGLEYTFSADVYAASGVSFSIQIAPSGASASVAESYVGNGHWQRWDVTLTAATATAVHDFIIDRPADQASDAAFYTDGWLAKTGSDNLYFDGDTVDPYQDEPQFYWNGARNASTSTRKASTRYGGTLLDISSYVSIKAIQGLGLTSFETNTSGLALGGELYQNTHPEAREFALLCRADIASTAAYGTLHRNLARIQKAVNPKRMKVDQPLRLLFVGYDSAGVEATDRVIIDCAYKSGLEGDMTGRNLKFPINFIQFDPLIPADGYNVTSLSASGTEVTTTMASGSCSILMVSQSTGVGTSLGDFSGNTLNLIFDNNGGEYIYGSFQAYAASADMNGIIYRSSAGVLSAIGTGSTGTVNDATLGLDGYLYIGTSATGIGGVAGCDYIAKTDGASFDPLAAGLDGIVYTLCQDNSGNVYAGGAFHNAVTGPVLLNHFGEWNGSAWVALSGATAGVNDVVRALVKLPNNIIILGGDFTTAGDASYPYLCTWNGSTYGNLGTAPNAAVYRLLYDELTGLLYAFGAFTSIGGISANYAAFWDGNNWNPMAGVGGALAYANLGENNQIFAMGIFTIDGKTYNLSIAKWNGSEWQLQEYKGAGSAQFWWNYKKNSDTVYLVSYSGVLANPSYTIPAVSTITNSTEGNIYPWVTFDNSGSYVYSLWNRTTGERIYLNGLTVGAGERIELAFTPTGYTINSNIRGDMRSSVLSGSSPTFHLQPGPNYVSVFVYPSPVTNITVPLKYPASGYLSLDETVYS